MRKKCRELPDLVAASVAIIAIALFPESAVSGDRTSYYELQRYKVQYTEEIFRYCLDSIGRNDPDLGWCMKRQQRIKDNILANALDELGRNSRAMAVYDDCVDYYPVSGVARIGACVDARLILHRKLDDDEAEQAIYQKCDEKWRKHGFRAVTNCSVHGANYYRDKGEFRD